MRQSGDGVAGGGPVGLLAALCGAVDALAAVSAGGLSVAQLQQALPALAGELDRLTGLRDALLAELDGRGGGSVPDRGPADKHSPGSIATVSWWRQAAGCGGPAAGAQLRTAGRLARLPRLAAAVVEGRVGHAQAVVLTRLLDRLGLGELLAAQDQLVVLGASRDPQWLAAWVREQIATYCEPDLDHAAARAAARRYLQLRDEHDGTVSGRFVLPSEQTEALHSVLAALSRRTGLHDERSAGQRRADSLLEVFELAARHGDLPDSGGRRTQVSYLLPAGWAGHLSPPPFTDTLGATLGPDRPAAGQTEGPAAGHSERDLRADQHTHTGNHTGGSTDADAHADAHVEAAAGPASPSPGRDQPSTGPWPGRSWCAKGAWSGPQTRAHLEAVLCDARLHRVLLDPDGQIRSLHTLTDTATPSQRAALAARDGGCAARGCSRPPGFCDAHHLTALAHAGPTTLANLVLLCRHHHRRWHLGQLHLDDLYVPWYQPPPAQLHVVAPG